MFASFLLLPLWYQYGVVFVFGLLIGSFLNVVVSRFNTGRSLSGHSHCMSCGKRLGWIELVPLLSYLVQRGRCRGCSSRVPTRYLWGELLTAIVFTLVYATTTDPTFIGLSFLLVALLIVIFFYDIDHLIIPDRLVVATALVAAGFLVAGEGGVPTAVTHGAAAAGTFAFFGGLWLVSKGRWIGLGDAKLAAPLALVLGPMGAFSMVVLSFWIGAVISVGILVAGRLWIRGQQHLRMHAVRFTMKSEVPFAPFIIISFLLVYLYAVDVIVLLERVLI